MSSLGASLLRFVLQLRRRLAGLSVPISVPLSGVLLLYAWRRLHPKPPRLVNWCGDFEVSGTASIVYPESEQEIRAIVLDARRKNERVKVAGGLHSWSDIAMPSTSVPTRLVVLDRFNRVIRLDEKERTITVEVRNFFTRTTPLSFEKLISKRLAFTYGSFINIFIQEVMLFQCLDLSLDNPSQEL